MDERALAERLITYDTSTLEGMQSAAGFVKGWLEARDVEVKGAMHNGRPVLAATIGPPQAPTVVLHGHLDVVPARPEQFGFQHLMQPARAAPVLVHQAVRAVGLGETQMPCAIDCHAQQTLNARGVHDLHADQPIDHPLTQPRKALGAAVAQEVIQGVVDRPAVHTGAGQAVEVIERAAVGGQFGVQPSCGG